MKDGTEFRVLQGKFVIEKFPTETDPTLILPGKGLFSLTVTQSEISLIREVELAETDDSHWIAIEVDGPLDFSLKGVLKSYLDPLAVAGISILAVSTFDTDFIFVPASEQEKAVGTLIASGRRRLDC